MKKITEIFAVKRKTLSFEFFPPKTPQGLKNLYQKVAPSLARLEPDFFSVTCTADSKDIKMTEDVAFELQRMFPDIAVMQHISISSIGSDPETISAYIDKIKSSKVIKNFLALRGDSIDKNLCGNTERRGLLKYASDLCQLIRERSGDYFSLAVAAYPDGHPECRSITECDNFLKIKFDSKCDFAITQFFFEDEKYFSLIKRIESLGVNTGTKRIIPGILPVTDFNRLVSFAQKCCVEIPAQVSSYFNNETLTGDSSSDIRRKGIEYAYNQARQLLGGGATGVHIFTLNQSEPSFEIASRLKSDGLLL